MLIETAELDTRAEKRHAFIRSRKRSLLRCGKNSLAKIVQDEKNVCALRLCFSCLRSIRGIAREAPLTE